MYYGMASAAGPKDEGEPANTKLEWKRLEGECHVTRILLLTLPYQNDYTAMFVHAMADATRAAVRGKPPHPRSITLRVPWSALQHSLMDSQFGWHTGGDGTKGRKYKDIGIMAAFLTCYKEYMSARAGHLDGAAAAAAAPL